MLLHKDQQSRCIKIQGDLYRDEILLVMSTGITGITTLSNEAIQPALPEPADISTHLLLLPRDDIAVLGQYQKESVSAYNWLSNQMLWRVPGIREMFYVRCCASRSLIILQLNGHCTEINAMTGQVTARILNTTCVATDSLRSQMLVLRGNRRIRCKEVEYRTDLASPSIFTMSMEIDSISDAVFADDCVIVSEPEWGSVMCWDHRGKQRWRYMPKTRDTFIATLTRMTNGELVFGTKFSHTSRVIRGVVFEMATGKLLHEQDIGMDHRGITAVANGRFLAAPTGLLEVSSMIWRPIQYRIG